jgi:signal transduction histidine kinase
MMMPTTAEQTSPASGTDVSSSPTPSVPFWRRLVAGVRLRILGWYIVLLVVAISASLLLERRVLLDRLDEEVEAQLVQERAEIANLATGNDPNTGEPFGSDVAAVFDTFLRRNVPGEGEAFLALVDGLPYLSTPAPHRLDSDPSLIEHWGRMTETESGELQTPAGPVRYLAVPLQGEGSTLGVFVVANFLRQEREEIEGTIRVGAAVAGSVLVVASALAWAVAGRLLRPIRLVTETARSIGESDLTRRIEVKGTDEVAELGLTFNHMLDRLEGVFTTQQSFLDDAGHELRTPITIVRGHLELLDEDPEDRQETLTLVLDELDRMSRIVDDLLLLAKVEQPDFLRAEQLDLGDLTRGWHARARTLADREWRLEQAAEAEVVADGQRLTQAMMNLAHNAAQHTEAGSVIDLGSTVTDGRARLWVRDRGPGVRPEDRERIFQRFARADDPRGRSEGAGLGLAIVSAIAAAHGGTVELADRPGGGSTFTIVIPARPTST